MNPNKIAALYASPIFNTLLRFPTYDTTTSLPEQLTLEVLHAARVVSPDGRCYHADAGYLGSHYRNDAGGRASGFLDEHCTQRQANWLLRQLPGRPEATVQHLHPAGLPESQTLLVTIWGYGQPDGPETLACLRYGMQQDFDAVLRGLASIGRKRRKHTKKLEAQLRAYHRQQELAQLRQGVWLGADKALTTAARVDEPGVPYLGDADLSAEQRRTLAYWAVPEGALMGPGFPAGTGLALRPVKRGRDLVDGAVYLYHYQLTDDCPLVTLGRLRLRHKSHGMLPLLRDEAPDTRMLTCAAWSDPKFRLYRVSHYTTRAAEPVASPAARALPLAPATEAQYPEQALALAA